MQQIGLLIALTSALTVGVSARAAVLVDTGLSDVVSIEAGYDEYFTCDDSGEPCAQDYELITNEASRFHVAIAGTGSSITLAAAHQDGADFYEIYADDGGQLLPDAEHLLWKTSSAANLLTSTALTGGHYNDDYYYVSRDTYDLFDLAFAAGDYWIVISNAGPTFGAEPALFGGTANGILARQKFYDNEPGPNPFVSYAGRQASVVIQGTVAPVPEPALWAQLLTGFSISGAFLRRRCHAHFASEMKPPLG